MIDLGNVVCEKFRALHPSIYVPQLAGKHGFRQVTPATLSLTNQRLFEVLEETLPVRLDIGLQEVECHGHLFWRHESEGTQTSDAESKHPVLVVLACQAQILKMLMQGLLEMEEAPSHIDSDEYFHCCRITGFLEISQQCCVLWVPVHVLPTNLPHFEVGLLVLVREARMNTRQSVPLVETMRRVDLLEYIGRRLECAICKTDAALVDDLEVVAAPEDNDPLRPGWRPES